MIDRAFLPLASVLLLLVAMPVAAEAPRDGAPTRVPLEAWVGEWTLDRDASDSVEPLLVLLDTPWVMRKAAGAMTPTFTFRVLPSGDGLHWVNENPIMRRERELKGDGVERSLEDPLGRTYTTRETWSDEGALRMRQTHRVGRRRVEVDATWARVGDRLEVVNRAQGADGPIEIRRVFRRSD